jgi:hypothetical protein
MSVKRPAFLFIFFIFLITLSTAAEDTTEQSRQVVFELDETTWVSDIDWNPENNTGINVEIQSEIPKQIAIQEIPDYQGKTGSFAPAKSLTLRPGTNQVNVPVNGRQNEGIALADSNGGQYYNRDPDASLPEAKGLQVLLFMGISIIFYEGFYLLRVRIRNALISVKPQRDL